MTAYETLDSLDAVKCFAEFHGDKEMNVMLNELIGKVETPKLQNVKQSTTHMFFKKRSCKLSRLTLNILRILSMIIRQFDPHCDFSKNVSSKDRVRPSFFVTFNINLKHIFPKNFIEFPEAVQKI